MRWLKIYALIATAGLLMGAYPGTKQAFLNLAQNWTATQTFDAVHTVTGLPSPSASTDATNKTYVDNIAAAINPAVAVKAATTQASDTSGLTYTHVAGIGDFFTGSVNTAITFDGQTLTAVNQRVLIKNDTQSPSGAFNGVYYLSQLQTGILAPILVRAVDYDQSSDINNTGAIPVVNGTVNASTSWLLTSSVTTVGTDPLTYSQFSIAPTSIMTTDTAQTVTAVKTYGNSQITPNNAVVAALLATGTSVSLTGPREYYVCTGTCTVTPPVPVAGYEFCVMNDDNVATAITLAALGASARYENTARTAYGTAGSGTLVSTAAAASMVCIVGLDSTHYLTTNFVGTWTAS